MNDENLIPNEQRTPSERRENAEKAGKASGKARRRRKALKELLDLVLEGTIEINGQTMGRDEAIAIAIIEKAQKGDVAAFLAIRDTLGEKPTEKVNMSVSDSVREAYERAAAAIRKQKD